MKAGKGLIKVNGMPIQLLEPEGMRLKAYEPILLLGAERFANVDIRVTTKYVPARTVLPFVFINTALFVPDPC